MEIDKIISELKSLDLSTYPTKEIKDLFNEVGHIGSIIVTYHKGKALMRARPNNGSERFNKKADFSYKPQKYNSTFQRASTPYQTMFYATTLPDKLEEGELDNMRIIGVTETIPMLRDKTMSGYQKISFGRWIVHEDINLMAIAHKNAYYKESNFTRELVDHFKDFLKKYPNHLIEKSLKFQNFLADEFSKENIQNDYDYMISAIFTENCVKNGLDGVLYPSVRTSGKGFNVALTPSATEKLGLYVAGECSIYKLRDHTVIGNDAIIQLDGKQSEFDMINIPNHQDACLAKLGVNSIDELTNSK
ncbi:hypothetical protein [Aestuariivivens marinum]|uniref:hypothetical protein n=1 Tax=Aestuariivivens marinum TaxID=2913555 RepID=UPI001F59CDDC|nr:hypothetical protein [Aestuariivivens marinum]